MFSGERGEVDFFGGMLKFTPHACTLPCHRLNIDTGRCMINIDRCMIKASDHDMLDHA